MSIEGVLRVTEIQRFCMHDGPGIRTTVFLKGCPLQCAWCHNPEAQAFSPELLFYSKKCMGCGACVEVCPHGAQMLGEGRFIDRTACVGCGACAERCPTGALELCGRAMTVDEILSTVMRDRAFYGETGGVTLSGGEPLAGGEGTISLLRACKEQGLHTVVETSGYADESLLRRAIPLVDLFLWDLKDTDQERHRRYTGGDVGQILANLRVADALGAKTRLRCILVRGVNTDAAHAQRIAEIFGELSNCEGVELIPYHAYGGTKEVFLGREDNGRRDWIPDRELIGRLRSLLEERGVFVF